MPLKNKRRAPAEDYDSDGGFIANDSDNARPKSKKTKTSKAATASGNSKSTQNGKGLPGGGQVGTNGEEFWELSGKRRVAISTYNGKQMVTVREYYEKDGQTLPGKKGISMTVEQFSALVTVLPHIESSLKAKAIILPRPEYGDGSEGDGDLKGEEDEEEEEVMGEGEVDEDEVVRKKGKKNFEETSEEDD